ncbi:MAG: hypothetical protein PHQ47_03250 [Candidatus Portnoybacteria bacterium]|nr:hypothetical protein [Candidatus Portnoybacteria bacterium]
MSRKQITILLILVAILTAGIFLFKYEIGVWPWQSSEEENLTPSLNGQVSPQSQETRQLIMQDVAVKINEISQVKPVLGGKWHVLRFWFVSGSDKDFYVEYEDGHIMAKLLLEAEVKGQNDIFYNIIGYFEPGDADWVLKSGKDEQFGKSLDLYEYNEANKNWKKKN